MIDATLSDVVREHAVDEGFVINEIKDYLSEINSACPSNNSLKVIRYSPKQVLRCNSFGSVVNVIRSKVHKISAIRLASWSPDSSN